MHKLHAGELRFNVKKIFHCGGQKPVLVRSAPRARSAVEVMLQRFGLYALLEDRISRDPFSTNRLPVNPFLSRLSLDIRGQRLLLLWNRWSWDREARVWAQVFRAPNSITLCYFGVENVGRGILGTKGLSDGGNRILTRCLPRGDSEEFCLLPRAQRRSPLSPGSCRSTKPGLWRGGVGVGGGEASQAGLHAGAPDRTAKSLRTRRSSSTPQHAAAIARKKAALGPLGSLGLPQTVSVGIDVYFSYSKLSLGFLVSPLHLLLSARFLLEKIPCRWRAPSTGDESRGVWEVGDFCSPVPNQTSIRSLEGAQTPSETQITEISITLLELDCELSCWQMRLLLTESDWSIQQRVGYSDW